VLHGDGATGAALVEHPGVAKVAFTGSATAGRAVYRSAADGIKRVTLELGGCSALVVDADADLARWLPAVLNRAFYNAGQYCFRVNRALVHERRYAEFVEGFAKAAAELAVGDPADERTWSGSRTPSGAARGCAWTGAHTPARADRCSGRRCCVTCRTTPW
jgi:acyl-CoA reductase-like NAD-dependent aldehyde dehydrogenase